MNLRVRISSMDKLLATTVNKGEETHFSPEEICLGSSVSTQQDIENLTNPVSYKGLYGFHKYWGKKPAEPLRFLINCLTEPGDYVLDPFLGSGAVAREAITLGRFFVGGDLNPFAVKLASFIATPCERAAYISAISTIENKIRATIDASYGVSPATTVSHLLWVKGSITQVWERAPGKRSRIERVPTSQDLERAEAFKDHIDLGTRPLSMFDNSRINSKTTLGWTDLFTGRALRNIRLILDEIALAPAGVREALELTLTASIGQMSRMVFAITSRGKKTGAPTNKIEVGSWVIGYWRPETHFEINVWNCFASRAEKLQKGLPSKDHNSNEEMSLKVSDAYTLLGGLEDGSIELLITDPPHGDRIPYLELSELWNATLNLQANMNDEIIVSNAKNRNKGPEQYQKRMSEFLDKAAKKLALGGAMALLFNSRRDDEWEFIRSACEVSSIEFVGAFPMNYSARSVVQDNRKGSMKNDFVLIFSNGPLRADRLSKLRSVHGWMDKVPSFGAVS